MPEEQQLAFITRMIEEIYDGNPWHGESICTKLRDVDYKVAMERPIAGVHTIYELVGHMISWRNYVVRKMMGDSAYKIELNSEKDWDQKSEHPPSSWDILKENLKKNQKLIMEELATKDTAWLNTRVPGTEDLSFERLMHGIIQHDIYHLGQIGLVKKMAGVVQPA